MTSATSTSARNTSHKPSSNGKSNRLCKAGAAQVAVDQQRAPAGTSQTAGQVTGDRGAAFLGCRTGDQHDLPSLGGRIVHQDGAHAVDRLGELRDDRMVGVDRLGRQGGQRADHANAKSFVDLLGAVEPAVAEFQVGNSEAGQTECTQGTEDGNGIVLSRVDAFGGNRLLELLDLRGRCGFDFQAFQLDAHVLGNFLELFDFGMAGFEVY